MIELYDFQAEAADQMASRVAEYVEDPVTISRQGSQHCIPFIQLLNSITASGKTVVMADAVSSIAKQTAIKPIVLWLSKATVVVEQSYANLDGGGVYHSLLDDFQVRLLADYDDTEVVDTDSAFLFFATVGLINQKDKEKGDRRVFRSAIDDAARSTWDSLKLRPAPSGHRRPLLVVYDEAHNLSDQQTDILLDLEPDAFLLATATQRLPKQFNDRVVDLLRRVGEKSDADLVTAVDAKAVADSGLIKTRIELVGRQAQMEQVISEMLDDLRQAERDAKAFGLEGLPKAVYVCKTNVVEGSDETDSPRQPFGQRQAPPILIWRHLVENLGIEPSQVAVYSNLKVDKNYPLPDEFVLYSGGENDYDSFIKGEHRHIIFNQSLQEGWDDPLVYFAYIDKSMGSRVQAEQIVGRLLRQPGRKHYPADRLNSAHIYVRVEATGVFDEVVQAVQEKIRAENLDIRLAKSPPGTPPREEVPTKGEFTVPRVAVVADEAEEVIAECIMHMTDYRRDPGENVTGVGRRTRVQRVIGDVGNERFVWEDYGESAEVLARWLFAREVRRVHQGALGLAVTSNADGSSTKFDARVGLGSNAAEHIADVARKVGQAFVDYTYLKVQRPNQYQVGPMLMEPAAIVPFDHAVHRGYDGLNGFELDFARALDRTKLPWTRNPARTGYGIRLVEPGRTSQFYPDFLLWKNGDVYAIETKGAYLASDALRKLVNIKQAAGKFPRVFIRFVLEGHVDAKGARADTTGYTLASLKSDGAPNFRRLSSIDEVVERALRPTA